MKKQNLKNLFEELALYQSKLTLEQFGKETEEYYNNLLEFVRCMKETLHVKPIPSEEDFSIRYGVLIENTVICIDYIIESCNYDEDNVINKTVKSDLIQTLLRTTTIFIHKSYQKEFDGPATVTIDSKKEDMLKVKISEAEKACGDWIEIPMFSFGPFCGRLYFSNENRLPFLWLLKEPYCKNFSEWEKTVNTPIGNNQAKEYFESGVDNLDNKTMNRIVAVSRIIDRKVNNKERILSDEEIFGSICVLQTNWFPGISLNEGQTGSDNSKIADWAKLNRPLIERLVNFYLLKIIIGGYTLGHFFNKEEYCYDYKSKESNRFVKLIEDFNDNKEIRLLGNRLVAYVIETYRHLGNKNLTAWGHQIYLDEAGRVYVDAYHPASSLYSDDEAKHDGRNIKGILPAKEKDSN